MVAEVRLLEKYKGLAFWDPNDKTTYTIDQRTCSGSDPVIGEGY